MLSRTADTATLSCALAAVLVLAACDRPALPVAPGDALTPAAERTALVDRALALQSELQRGTRVETRMDDLRRLVTDIQAWNERGAGPAIELSASPELSGDVVGSTRYTVDRLPGPQVPRQPCLLLPCEPITVGYGWVCFNTGTAGCNAQGVLICTYLCIRVGGSATTVSGP